MIVYKTMCGFIILQNKDDKSANISQPELEALENNLGFKNLRGMQIYAWENLGKFGNSESRTSIASELSLCN